MPFEILHFRGSEKILKEKKMTREIKLAVEYLNDCLYGTYRKGELLRQALQEMDWRQNGDLNVLDGRRYFYKVSGSECPWMEASQTMNTSRMPC